jgi:hypothetical protein
MALRIVIHLTAGNLLTAVGTALGEGDQDIARQVDFLSPQATGGIDWGSVGAKLGKSAGGIARMAGGMMRLAPQMILLTIGEWLLEGFLARLQTSEGAGVADAIAKVGDVVLDLAAKILPPVLEALGKVIGMLLPIVIQMTVFVRVVWPVIGPVLGMQWQVFLLFVDLQSKIWDGILGLATFVGGVATYVAEQLRLAGAAFGVIIADLPGAAQRLLQDILGSVLGPLQDAMDAVSSAWDEAQGVFQHAGWSNSYWYNGREYPVGTGPYPDAPPGFEYFPQHPRVLQAAVRTWVQDNGGPRMLERRLRVAS